MDSKNIKDRLKEANECIDQNSEDLWQKAEQNLNTLEDEYSRRMETND